MEKSFLGQNKVVNYQEVVEMMLKNFQVLETRMSIKIPYLNTLVM